MQDVSMMRHVGEMIDIVSGMIVGVSLAGAMTRAFSVLSHGGSLEEAVAAGALGFLACAAGAAALSLAGQALAQAAIKGRVFTGAPFFLFSMMEPAHIYDPDCESVIHHIHDDVQHVYYCDAYYHSRVHIYP